MKKGKKDIIRINSKKKVIGFISVFLVLIVGIVSVLLLNKKDISKQLNCFRYLFLLFKN